MSQPQARETPELWATVRAAISASASSQALHFDGEIEVESIGPSCQGKPFRISDQRSVKAPPAYGLDPSVSVTAETWCIPLAPDVVPAEIWGARAPVQRAGHGELITGEEFTWLDPDELQSAGAYLYLPGRNGGFEVSAYALLGRLQIDEQPYAQSAVTVKARWVMYPTRDARHFLTLETFGQLPVALTVIVEGERARRE